MEWQTIETAPKDTGENVLVALFEEDGSYWAAVASYWVDCWAFMFPNNQIHGYNPILLGFEPTHWQPLPKALKEPQ